MSKHKETETKTPIYLTITEERSTGGLHYSFYHLYGRISTQAYDSGVGYVPRGVEDDYTDGLRFTGLRISCQGDSDSQKRTDGGAVYGWDVLYRDIYSVNARLAQRMSKTLNRIDARLTAIQESRGYVKSYGEYCGRIAEALGCSGIAVQRTPHAETISGSRWDWMAIGQGVNAINGRIFDWHRESLPTPRAEAADSADSAAEVAS